MITLDDGFYDKLFAQLSKYVKDTVTDEEETLHEDCDFYIDITDDISVYISLDITVFAEYHDESFDHAFGTWKDPYAGFYPSGYKVELINEICVDDGVNEYEPIYDKERIIEMEDSV